MNRTPQPASLVGGFWRSASSHPDRPALSVAGVVLTYAELRARASLLAGALQRIDPAPPVPLTAISAARSPTAYSAILGALARGHGYVPLNPSFPPERNGYMLAHSGAQTLIVDAGCAVRLPQVLSRVDSPVVVLLPDA